MRMSVSLNNRWSWNSNKILADANLTNYIFCVLTSFDGKNQNDNRQRYQRKNSECHFDFFPQCFEIIIFLSKATSTDAKRHWKKSQSDEQLLCLLSIAQHSHLRSRNLLQRYGSSKLCSVEKERKVNSKFLLVKSSEIISFFYLHFTWLCGSWKRYISL